jgi:hypothetical protein
MTGLTVRPIREDIKLLQSEALIVGFYEDVRPLKGLAGELDWLLCGSLSRLILMNKLHGALGEVALFTSQNKLPARKIFLLGLGPRAEFSPAALRSAAEIAAKSALDAGVGEAVIEYFQPPDIPYEKGFAAYYDGLNEGAGGRGFDVLLFASDTGAYDHLSRVAKS